MNRNLALMILAAVCAACLQSDASARPSPSGLRQRTAGVIAEMFERFFFVSWLGEPMSLRGSGACPEPQLREALGQRDGFPESFRRRVPDPNISARYCGAVAVARTDAKWLGFTIRSPKAGPCEDHAKRWKAVVAQPTMADAIVPYVVSDDVYDKYGIEGQSRTVYRPGRDMRSPQILHQSLNAMRRVRLVSQSEANAFCVFVFSHAKSADGNDRRD